MNTRKLLQWGGVVAAVVLVVFGIVSIVLGIQGGNTVNSDLNQQKITGTPDMTPTAITAEAKQAGLKIADTPIPTCTVANLPINSGSRARCFAQYMNVHALEATGGLVYAEMPHYATADGKGTNDPTKAQKDAHGQPVDNPARDVWINQIALSTALNASYMASNLALFGIVVGVALLLAGIGFGVLALAGGLRGGPAEEKSSPVPAAGGTTPAPA
jgi:hypothetical protein